MADRLSAYTDAIVAIPLTLLILPLMDATFESNNPGTAIGFFDENRDKLLGFFTSYFIIYAQWTYHHNLFEHAEKVSVLLRSLNKLWTLSIVFMPVSTALVVESPKDRAGYAVFLGNQFFSRLVLGSMQMVLIKDPRTWHPESHGHLGKEGSAKHVLVWVLSGVCIFILTLMLCLFTGVGQFGLLIIFFEKPIWYIYSLVFKQKQLALATRARSTTDNPTASPRREEVKVELRSLQWWLTQTENDLNSIIGDAERLIAYTDGIVAIALTLLILPLMDGALSSSTLGAGVFFDNNKDILLGFFASYLLIYSQWGWHHSLFEHAGKVSVLLRYLNEAWTLGIVFMPVSTAMLVKDRLDRPSYGVYLGNLAYARLMLTFLQLALINDPRTWHPNSHGHLQKPGSKKQILISAFVVLAVFLLTLMVCLFTNIGSAGIFILFLEIPIWWALENIILKRANARPTRSRSETV
ncbi:hypothetical protein TrVE_jg4161 [Triparma verrucosa]|uniref:Endosomal/lysosomal proton channel TMEM175 n=1 Tax=Triparma verrucosa TaxID=1606542 RepID=A0A9W7BGU1_9STRA|nr:hypothetical protein TrVE_jg4161 [Triparma verrucosa]